MAKPCPAGVVVFRSEFGEYYDPYTGEALGSTYQSWTAVVALDWLLEPRSDPGAADRPGRVDPTLRALEDESRHDRVKFCRVGLARSGWVVSGGEAGLLGEGVEGDVVGAIGGA